MRSRLLAAGLAALMTGACAAQDSPSLASAGLATEESAPAPVKDAAKRITRSLWGVVPDAPAYKKDLRPELIRGSAVAVGPDTLLVSCRAVDGRRQVGLVRHAKYYVARVTPDRPGNGVCTLRVAESNLEPVAAIRSLAGLRPGEPVYAIVNRDSAKVALAEVPLTGRRLGDSRLATGLELPPGPLSVVLFDASGNLLGLAVPGATREVKAGRTVAASAMF